MFTSCTLALVTSTIVGMEVFTSYKRMKFDASLAVF